MSNGEVKLGLYMTTGRHHGQTFRAIRDMVEKLLPNGEIKVTTPDMQALERIVAEKDAEIERLKRANQVVPKDAELLALNGKFRDTIAAQKRVIEKLKIIDQDFARHDDCSCIVEDDDPCGCGLSKVREEIEAIEKGWEA